ncbi:MULTISPECIES: hypothetical protein [Nocardia]|uniref:Uncharacterized protein n=1 Tax=Nocardia africana TaxID=134964 RepID=A0A378X6R1_9NOCA|nr:hypothetical protein [Nocardia africana]MCC3317914.1 hypothetical protein [Nocardia africana]SUA48687.1 Uncharacterised protein [Nocardia africana]
MTVAELDLPALVAAVADELGQGWAVDANRARYYGHATVRLRHTGGGVLVVHSGNDSHRTTDHGRLFIRPDYGQLATHITTGEDRGDITVADTTAPPTIASHITRRLMPRYIELLARCQRRADLERETDARREAFRSRLLDLLPHAERASDPVSFGKPGAAVSGNVAGISSSGTAKFTIDARGEAANSIARTIADLLDT